MRIPYNIYNIYSICVLSTYQILSNYIMYVFAVCLIYFYIPV